MVKDAEPTTKLFHRAAEGFDIARKSCPTPEGFAAGSPSAAASGVMTDRDRGGTVVKRRGRQEDV
jgi:hypothetical protein